MRKKNIIGSIFLIFLLVMLPSISAVEYNSVEKNSQYSRCKTTIHKSRCSQQTYQV